MPETKSALVTGATSGIGRQIALDLHERGYHVHAVGRDATRLTSLADDRITTHAVDLTKDEQVNSLASVGDVDLLVHAAGVVTLGPIVDAPIADFDKNIAVNLRAPVLLTHLLIGGVIRKRGWVVFVNSGAGLNANPKWGHYAASKFGLKAVADALRQEVRGEGVRVLSVYPGRTATPMQQAVRAYEGAPYEAKRFIQVEDVSRMVLEAISLPRTASVIDLNIRTGPG